MCCVQQAAYERDAAGADVAGASPSRPQHQPHASAALSAAAAAAGAQGGQWGGQGGTAQGNGGVLTSVGGSGGAGGGGRGMPTYVIAQGGGLGQSVSQAVSGLGAQTLTLSTSQLAALLGPGGSGSGFVGGQGGGHRGGAVAMEGPGDRGGQGMGQAGEGMALSVAGLEQGGLQGLVQGSTLQMLGGGGMRGVGGVGGMGGVRLPQQQLMFISPQGVLTSVGAGQQDMLMRYGQCF